MCNWIKSCWYSTIKLLIWKIWFIIEAHSFSHLCNPIEIQDSKNARKSIQVTEKPFFLPHENPIKSVEKLGKISQMPVCALETFNSISFNFLLQTNALGIATNSILRAINTACQKAVIILDNKHFAITYRPSCENILLTVVAVCKCQCKQGRILCK